MFEPIRRTFTRPWMDEREYQANAHGLQIVFGAVLGFVLAGAEDFAPFDFAALLLVTIGAVVSILYISASRYRLAYTGLALGYALVLPAMVLRITDVPAPEKLAPTLLIWTLFQVAMEFAPRRRADAEVSPGRD